MYAAALAKPEYKTTLEHSNATNKDIRDIIHKNFPRAVEQTKNFASRFKGDSARQTAHNIWKFLKEHITYRKDDEDSQLIRLPSRFVGSDCTGDCKSYSLTAASLLRNNGLPVSFRYAGYNGSTVPTHVYTVTRDENGKEIIVDGVWKYFDSEKKPSLKFDESMDVYTLSGIDGIGRRKGGFFKKFVHLNKKLALASSRRPFLTLVALNIFGLARKIYATNKKNPGAIRKLWVDRLGGDYKKLMKSTKIGYNRWLKRHHRPRIAGIDLADCCAGIGFPPAVAAYVAAAASIIPVFTSAFKKSGVKDEPGEATGEETVTAAQDAQSSNPDAQQTVAGIEGRFRVRNFVKKQRARRRKMRHRFGPPGLRDDLTGIGKARKKGLLKKIFKGVKKISLAPNRRAFRTLIATNAGGIALKLARIHNSSDRNELKKRWEKIGGKYSDLVKSIKAGMKRVPKKKRIAISAAQQSNASGWAALAASVLKLFSSLFKKHEKKDADGNPLPGETPFENMVEVAEKAAAAAGEPSAPADEQLEAGTAEADSGESDEPTTAGFSLSGNGMLMGGTALAAVVLFSSKKANR